MSEREAELARRLLRKSTILIGVVAVALVTMFVANALDDVAVLSVRWWLQTVAYFVLGVIVFAAMSDRQYARRVLTESR